MGQEMLLRWNSLRTYGHEISLQFRLGHYFGEYNEVVQRWGSSVLSKSNSREYAKIPYITTPILSRLPDL